MSADPAFEAVVDQVGQLLHRQIGLRPEPTLRGRLRRCIRDDASDPGRDFGAYVESLTIDRVAMQRLIDRVTVQETSFFRHPEHYELLARDILPRLGSPVTIWSAACSNGQEAFSLAMVLEEQGIAGSVIATDLSSAALRRTAAGRYAPREVTGLSAGRLARHMTREGDLWQVTSPVRERVGTLRHNLLDALPSQVRGCQIVFCRNVLIYLSPEYTRTFLDRVAAVLPEATLFLGAAETIWQLSDRFETVRTGDTFSYRRRPEAIPVRSRPNTASSRTPRAHDLRGYDPRGYDPHAHDPHAHDPRAHDPRARDVHAREPRARNPRHPGLVRRAAIVPVAASVAASENDSSVAVALGRAGQQASAAGDTGSAVVAFRKCAYLTPRDPMAHLHLGLALDTAGDRPAAQRAYAAARRALIQSDPADITDAAKGYTAADLFRLLDDKQRPTP